MVAHMARTDARHAQVTVWILCFALCFCIPVGLWLIRGGLEHEDEARAARIRNERQRKELEQLKSEVKALIAEKGSNDSKRNGNND